MKRKDKGKPLLGKTKKITVSIGMEESTKKHLEFIGNNNRSNGFDKIYRFWNEYHDRGDAGE